jgi:uncharacterized protein YunC (DUF1805 family)
MIKIYDELPTDLPQTARIKHIQSVLDNRGLCTCEIRPDMTDAELLAVESCNPYWICGILDGIRRTEVGSKPQRSR